MNKERIGPDSTDASRISAREKGVYGVVANQSHMSEKNKHEQRLLKNYERKMQKRDIMICQAMPKEMKEK